MSDLWRRLRAHRLVRDGFWIVAGQGGSMAARLLGLRLLTSLVSPVVYAEVVLLLGLATLATNLFCQPFTWALQRFYPDAVMQDRVGALRALIGGMLARGTLLMGGALALGGSLWSVASGEPRRSLGFLLAAAFLALDVTRMFESDQLNASRRQALHSVWALVDAWLRPGLAVAAILLLGPLSASILLGYIGALALGLAAFRPLWHRGVRPAEAVPDPWSQRTRAAVLRFAAPLVPLALVGWVTSLGDRYLLAGFTGARETGIYAAAYGIASMPFIMLSTMAGLAFRPAYYDAVARADLRRERRIAVLWGAVLAGPALVGLGLIALLAEPIVHLLVGEAFWDAAALLPWIALAYAIQSVQQLFEMMLVAQQRTRRLLAVRTSSAVTAAIAYLILIPPWGGMGAAVGTIVGMSASFVAALWLSGAVPRYLLGAGAKPRE